MRLNSWGELLWRKIMIVVFQRINNIMMVWWCGGALIKRITTDIVFSLVCSSRQFHHSNNMYLLWLGRWMTSHAFMIIMYVIDFNFYVRMIYHINSHIILSHNNLIWSNNYRSWPFYLSCLLKFNMDMCVFYIFLLVFFSLGFEFFMVSIFNAHMLRLENGWISYCTFTCEFIH